MQIGITVANHRTLISKDYIREAARMAEDLGFDSVWIPDHVVVPRAVEAQYGSNYYDALAVLAYLAGITRRVRLGTTVLVLPYRHPIVLAKQVASIDQLSDGRLILGVGVGWAEAEFQALGLPFAERGRVTDEALRAMRVLWTEDRPRYAGTYQRFSDVRFEPKPIQRPLPIWIGGKSGAARRRALEFGASWHPSEHLPFERLRDDFRQLHDLARSGGKPTPPLCPRFTVRMGDRSAGRAREFLEGDADAIAEDLRRVAALGAAHVVLSTPVDDAARFRWEIETLAREVLPRLRERPSGESPARA